MSKIKVEATEVFNKNYGVFKLGTRYIINQGGSRSSKTISLCQLVVIISLQTPGLITNIFRKTLVTAKRTILKDFKEVLESMGVTNYKYRISDCSFTFSNGAVVTFYGADDDEKLRGLKSNIAWLNEATEFQYDDFQQIAMRTTGQIILDFNPSAISSWIYDLPPEKSAIIHSTYKDNPFLSDEQIDLIESYKHTDLNYYKIFALGQRANSKENVYEEWEVLKNKPDNLNDYVYGLDFGFTHPTALVKIWYNADKKDNQLFIEELIYESGLTSTDLVNRLNILRINRAKPIIADYARPEIIQDLRRAHYTVIDAIKDVKDGINNVKTFKVFLSHTASNIIKENNLYKYKKLNGSIVDDVVKLNDDAMDAIRYGVFYIKKYLKTDNKNLGVYRFTI